MTRATIKIHPSNKSNPGCMTVESRDGSDASLEKIAALFPTLVDGGYCEVLREVGGRDLLDVSVLHGGETGNDKDQWDASVWSEGGRYKAVDVSVTRGHCLHFGYGTSANRWWVRVRVSPHAGRSTTFDFPVSYRTYRKLDARAFVARALTAYLNNAGE